MREVAKLTVPRLADLCVIDLLDEQGAINDVAVVAADAEIARGLEALRARSPLDPDGEHPVARVIRSGQPELLAEMAAQLPENVRGEHEPRGVHDRQQLPLGGRRAPAGARPDARRDLDPAAGAEQAARSRRRGPTARRISSSPRSSRGGPRWRSTTPACSPTLRRLEQRLEAILIERRGGDHGDRSRRPHDLRQSGRRRPAGVSHARRADRRAPRDDHVSLSRLRRAGRASSAWSRCPQGDCSRVSIQSRCW